MTNSLSNRCIHFMVVMLCFLSISGTGLAQELIDVEDRLAWKLNKDLPRDFTIALTDQFKLNTYYPQDTNMLSMFARGGWDRVVRLRLVDTVLLVAVGTFDEQKETATTILSARYVLLNESKMSFYEAESYSVNSLNLFLEAVSWDFFVQKPVEPYYRDLDVKIYAVEPEELHVELTGGSYGNATLIYTPLSAKPEIIYQ